MHTGNKSALPATSIKASTTPGERRYIAICGASHRVVNMGAFIFYLERPGHHFKELFSLLSKLAFYHATCFIDSSSSILIRNSIG